MQERRTRVGVPGRPPPVPARPVGRGAGSVDDGGGISLKQAALYFVALLAGMFVALLVDSGDSPVLGPGSSQNSRLYKVLAPSPVATSPPPLLRLGDQPKAEKHATAEPSSGASRAGEEGVGMGALADEHAAVKRSKTEGATMAALTNTPPERLWMGAREVSRCEDSCPGARNGKCEDGRSGVDFEHVGCDLGTDCSDCGEWRGQVTESLAAAAKEGSMIADLRAEKSEVIIRKTMCPPTFMFAYTNPQFDVDVSSHVHNAGCLERDLTFTWHKLLAERCAAKPEVVVDVGGNFGWYTIYAARMGCRVVTWEPVPRFRAFLLYNVLVNNVGHLVEVRDSVVTNEGVAQTVIVPQRGIWGTAGIGGMNIDRAIDNEGDYLHVVSPSERVDEVVNGPVALMKVDVEGFEPTVMASARKLLRGGALDHIFLEYSPGVGHRAHNWTMTLGFPLMLKDIVDAGYNIRSFETPGLAVVQYDEWESAELQALEMVTADNLKYDIRDWQNAVHHNSFGCDNRPKGLMGIPKYSSCNAIPEGLHPMSFHSVFSHNTNIWAARKAVDNYVQGPVTGVLKPSDDYRSYFTTRMSPDGPRGMGGRVCRHLPPAVHVFHHCRCLKPEICGEEEATVASLFREAPANIND